MYKDELSEWFSVIIPQGIMSFLNEQKNVYI